MVGGGGGGGGARRSNFEDVKVVFGWGSDQAFLLLQGFGNMDIKSHFDAPYRLKLVWPLPTRLQLTGHCGERGGEGRGDTVALGKERKGGV